MNPGEGCPPCKIIIDGGRLAAALDLLAMDQEELAPAAMYYGAIVRADVDAMVNGIKSGRIRAEKMDEAHAWSELNCHRAAMIEASILEQAEPVTPEQLYAWATEDRLQATKLAGGEYRGAFVVDGVVGISSKG